MSTGNMMGRSLAERLRSETAELHAAAEGTSFQRAMGRGEITRPQYTRYLYQLRAIHRAIEEGQSATTPALPVLAPFVRAELGKVTLLEEDLSRLGDARVSVEPLVETRKLAEEIRRDYAVNPIRLIGSIYVMEGSTNGGRFIAVSLQHSLGLVPPNGLRYLDPYGTAQRTMWARFRADLDSAALSHPEQDAVVDAAKTTFRGFTDVLDALWSEFTASRPAPETAPARA